MMGPRWRSAHLIRRPMHNPGWVLGVVLPCAVFYSEALRVVEIYRPHVFLIDLQA